ncbi:hypothetical protein [Limnoglobus roseus]|nr:hypothetical protein [Limnoglobus roseus]
MVLIGKRLEELEKPKAAERKGGRPAKEETAGKKPAVSEGDVRDKVGAAIGVSGSTYEKAKQVVEQGAQSLVTTVHVGPSTFDSHYSRPPMFAVTPSDNMFDFGCEIGINFTDVENAHPPTIAMLGLALRGSRIAHLV